MHDTHQHIPCMYHRKYSPYIKGLSLTKSFAIKLSKIIYVMPQGGPDISAYPYSHSKHT